MTTSPGTLLRRTTSVQSEAGPWWTNLILLYKDSCLGSCGGDTGVMPRDNTGWEPPETSRTPRTGSGSMESQCQCHSGTCLEAMRTAPGLMEPRAGSGQTQTVIWSWTTFVNTVSLDSVILPIILIFNLLIFRTNNMWQARAASQLHPHLLQLQCQLQHRVCLWWGTLVGGSSQENLSSNWILLRVSSCLQM